MRQLIIATFILVILFTSACANPAEYNNLVTDYNDLSGRHQLLVEEYNNLIQDYNELHTANKDLVDKYNALSDKYNESVTEFRKYADEVEQYNRELKDKVEQHNRELKDIIDNLAKQLEGSKSPPYLLIENRKVHMVFRNLNGAIEGWSYDVEALESSIILGHFMRTLEISELKYLRLSDIASRFQNDSKYIQLQGHGNALDFRPYVFKENFASIAQDFFSQHSDDEGKIREVWNMVTQLNKYSTEITDTPRLPLETLLLGGGDCEDLAILTASILKAMPAEWEVSLVYMDSNSPEEIIKMNHISVYVDTGRYKTFVESTENKVMSPWNKVDGVYLQIK